MTEPLDLDRLREVAKKATPGPWTLIGGGEYLTPIGLMVAPDDGGVWPEDATHIAAFDPPTVLALLDRVAELEAKVARVNAEYARHVCDRDALADKVARLEALRQAAGRSEAEIKAEALREAADAWPGGPTGFAPIPHEWLRDRAARLAKETDQ